MQLTTYAVQRTGKTFDELFVSGKLARFAEREDGGFTIAFWDESLGKTPSDAELDGAFAKPEPAPIPDIISDRQFAQQGAVQGLINQGEALAWVSAGTIPDMLKALVAKMPADQQFATNMKLAGATSFDRTDPTTIALTELFGWDDAARSAFWAAAGAL